MQKLTQVMPLQHVDPIEALLAIAFVLAVIAIVRSRRQKSRRILDQRLRENSDLRGRGT